MVQGQHKKLITKLIGVAIAMFGFGFALVPLYDVFCDVTGLNGKTNTEAASAASISIDKSRTVTIQFVSQTNEEMPWQFKPMQTKITVHPGELKRINYLAKNLSSEDMVGQAVPSVAPGLAAQYFQKTECFCFTQQPLKANESVEMPVVFMIDPELPEQYKTITLSYTMFDADGLKQPSNQQQGTF